MKKHKYHAEIDLKPALSEEQLYDRITRDFALLANHAAQGALVKLLPASMQPVMVARWGIDPATKANQITREQKRELVRLMKHWNVPIDARGDLAHAVITSGGYERYFEEDGQTYWHIMDPETAAPARSGLKSVTIVSPLGVYCDTLSTAVFVRGADWGADFWRTHQDFEMVLVLEDGSLWVTAGLAGSFTLAEDYQDLEVTVIQL